MLSSRREGAGDVMAKGLPKAHVCGDAAQCVWTCYYSDAAQCGPAGTCGGSRTMECVMLS